MNVLRICLLLVTLGAIRVTLTGAGNEGLLIAVIGFALCLGFLDRRLQPTDQAATKYYRQIEPEPEDPDEGRG